MIDLRDTKSYNRFNRAKIFLPQFIEIQFR